MPRRPGPAAALALLALAAPLAACSSSSSSTEATGGDTAGGGQVVTVYLGRQYGIEAVFEEFTKQTGIQVKFTSGKDPELREKLKSEGANTPADVLLTADAGNLELADRDGLLAPLDPGTAAAVPENLRDPENHWMALSRRARTIVYSTERVQPDQLSTYESLADPTWKGRLCLRPGSHPYTQSLVSNLIDRNGEAATEQTVRGWVANEPTYIDSDTKILEAIDAGECDVAIVNSYYVGRYQAEGKGATLAIFWPNAAMGGNGVHVNISGAGLTREAPNPQGAARLIAWLATDGQRAFADANFEFPANPSVPARPELVAWGSFTADPIWVGRFGELQPQAVDLLDRAGYQ